MYCKSCKYTSFDHLQACPRCGQDWSEVQKALNLDWLVEPASQSKGQDGPYLNPEEFDFQDQQDTAVADETEQDHSELEFASLDEDGQLQSDGSGLIDFDLEEESDGSTRADEDDEIIISEPEIDLEAETSLLDFSEDDEHEDSTDKGSAEEEISFPELDELFSTRQQSMGKGREDHAQVEAGTQTDDDLDVLMDLDLDADEEPDFSGDEDDDQGDADQPASERPQGPSSDLDEESDLSTLFDDIEIEIDSDDDQGHKDS